MSDTAPTLDPGSVGVGDPLPPLTIDVTTTRIVVGAIATRDFMPVHHDRDVAASQGASDVFLNILSDNGYCSRYLTDWAGPDALLRRIALRLGVPAYAGSTLTFTGSVTGIARGDDEVLVDVSISATNDLGEHVGGTATLSLPPAVRP